ncbi:MAG: BF3164 family lipoprotein [Prolixibacteraceae bacterium]
MKKKNLYFSRIKTIVIKSLFCFLLASCDQKSVLHDKPLLFSKFEKEEQISFTDICELKDGVAGILKLVDSTLIIFNVSDGADYFLYNYSLVNRQLSKGYLRVGKGPGEAIGARGIGINGNSLWLQDVSLKKILTVNKSTAISNNGFPAFNEYKVNGNHSMIDFKDSLHYFSVGSKNSKFKVQEFNLVSDKEVDEYAQYYNIPSNISFDSYKSAYQFFIYSKPTGDKIALSYRFLDAIEIYDIKSKRSIVVHGPEQYDVKFGPLETGMIRTDETRFAFVNGTVTNDYIYMSYSGVSCNSEKSHFGNSVYVYDWKGNPIKKLILDRLIDGLAVSEDNKTLYAYDVNNGLLIRAKIN